MLPPDASFLVALELDYVVGPGLTDEEKDMLLGALRFYFGPAQWWNAVGRDKSLGPLRFYFRPDLGNPWYVSHAHSAPDKLYATKLKNRDEAGQPSYFLYEAQNNLTFYVGTNFLHDGKTRKVINALVLDQRHRPLSSNTLQFWFEDNPMRPPDVKKLQADNIHGQLNNNEKEMLIDALRFYFGPAQFEPLKAVEQQTGLGELSAATDTRNNAGRLPSYILNGQNHRFYVGPLHLLPDDVPGAPPDFGARSIECARALNVVTPIVPNQKHLLKFGFEIFEQQADSNGLPELRPNDVVGDLDPYEKNMLLGALRFYFEPAKYLNAVSKDKDFGPLEFYFRSDKWKWWLAVVGAVAKDAPAASEERRAPDQLKLRAIKLENLLDERGTKGKPSYFLYEAQSDLMLYVGPNFEHGRSDITVINTVVLSPERVPQSSHTLYFGFLDRGPHEISKGLDGSFLDELEAKHVVGRLDSDPQKDLDQKQTLLVALGFYFGPATKFWNAVTKDPLKPDDLNNLNKELRKPDGRYETLEKKMGLGPGYFDRTHEGSDHVKLYALKEQAASESLPSYVLHEAQNNLMFYVGPDNFHGEPNRKVINTIVLDQQHRPLESHTLDFSHTLDLK
jgi:hypothetical protein